MSITRNFKLFLNAGKKVPLLINVSQYDQGETWIFTLYNADGTQYTPATGAIVGMKSDGNLIANAGTVNAAGQVVIEETEQMTASAGKAVFELQIDNDTHGTANFILFVEQSPTEGGTVSDSDLSLIQQALDSTNPEAIAQGVSDWMDENLTPTTPVVDSSLTVQGAAADAKATGDAITILNSALNEGLTTLTLTWENGMISTSTGENNNDGVVTTSRCTEYTKVSDLYKVENQSNLELYVYFYEREDETYSFSNAVALYGANSEYYFNRGSDLYVRFAGRFRLERVSDFNILYYPPIVADVIELKLASDTISVKSFGAVGDGVTDDSQAIINAVTYAREKGKKVYIPSGTFLISRVIDCTDVSISGCYLKIDLNGNNKAGCTVLKANSANGMLLYTSATATGIERILLKNIFLNGNGLAEYCVKLDNKSVEMEHVYCTNALTGMMASRVYNGLFTRCIFNNNLGYGIYLNVACNNLLFMECLCGGNSRYVGTVYGNVRALNSQESEALENSNIKFVACELDAPFNESAFSFVLDECCIISFDKNYFEGSTAGLFNLQNVQVFNFTENYVIDADLNINDVNITGNIVGNSFKLFNKQSGSLQFNMNSDSLIGANYIGSGYELQS